VKGIKKMKTIAKLMLLAVLVIGVIGCSSSGYMSPCNECPFKNNPLIVSVDLQLDPVELPKPVAAAVKAPTAIKIKEKVLFDFDSYALDTEAGIIVEKVANLMAKYPDTIIVLKGHTDKHGPTNYNQTLSENRANAVKNALVDNGVGPIRIAKVEGFGKTQLIPNLTDRENRRVLILSFGDN